MLLAATGGTVGMAGCSWQRETVVDRSASLTIPAEEYHHEPLDLGEVTGRQYNLTYTVTGEGRFDTFLFGGQASVEAFGTYREAVRGETDRTPAPSDRHSVPGAEGQAEVSRPLRTGLHHLVVDNTSVGEATPDGPLSVDLDLSVSRVQLLPDAVGG